MTWDKKRKLTREEKERARANRSLVFWVFIAAVISFEVGVVIFF